MPVYKNYIFRTTNRTDTKYIYNYLEGLGYKTNEILDNNYDEWNYYILVKTVEKYCVAGSKHSEQDVIDVITKNYPDTYMRIYDMDSLEIFQKLVDFTNRPSYKPRKILIESINSQDEMKTFLTGGKYDILLFTIPKNDMNTAYEVKTLLRKIGIDNYELLNDHEIFDTEDDVYIIFTKRAGDFDPFELLVFGNHMIYDFFKDCYPEFNNPSPIMLPDVFMDYLTKTALRTAKSMYSPKKMNRDI